MKNLNNHCSMFGAFNLRDGTDIQSYQDAFDAFCNQLKSEGYLHSWRVWERANHSGYDVGFPDVAIMIEMCFHSHLKSLECWDYIEAGKGPVHPLHIAVNKQVKESIFVLFNEVSSQQL